MLNNFYKSRIIKHAISALVFGVCIFIALGSTDDDSGSTSSSSSSSSFSSSTTKTTSWRLGTFVDEFGDRTNEKYVGGEFPGKMYNTATDGSRAKLEIFIKKNGKSFIRIYEYNSTPVSGYSSGTEYSFKFRGDNGIEKSFSWKWYDNNEVVFGPKNTSAMRDLFTKCNSVKVRITNIDTPTTRYAFTIDCYKFSEVICQL